MTSSRSVGRSRLSSAWSAAAVILSIHGVMLSVPAHGFSWVASPTTTSLSFLSSPPLGVASRRGFSGSSVRGRQKATLLALKGSSAGVLPRRKDGAKGGSSGAASAQMISSMFKWRKEGDDEAPVNIEAPTSNSRRISSSIVVNRPLQDVWRILTDYDNLTEYVPNLTQSRTIPRGPNEPPRKGVRLFQEGAQTIIGFNFRASLTMDMEEIFEGEDEKLGQRRIKFKLVDSAMFNDFSGEWRLQCYSRIKTECGDWSYSTKLFYMVTVKPKGPVPVGALEWRIKEDVPTNLKAVKAATELIPWDCSQNRASSEPAIWQQDETLQAYMPCNIADSEANSESSSPPPASLSSSSSTLTPPSSFLTSPSSRLGGGASAAGPSQPSLSNRVGLGLTPSAGGRSSSSSDGSNYRIGGTGAFGGLFSKQGSP